MHEPDAGWASRSVTAALVQASALGIGAFHLVLAGAVVISHTRGGLEPLVLALHALAAVLSAAVFWRPLPAVVYLLPLYGALVADFCIAQSPSSALACAATWCAIMAVGAPILFWRGWPAAVIPGASLGMMVGAVVLSHEDWGSRLPVFLGISGLGIIAISIGFVHPLRRFAARADVLADEALSARRQVAASRDSTRRRADHSRLVHDTIINTLGAIAAGTSDEDRDIVRRRCEQDVHVISALHRGEAEGERGLFEAVDALASVQWTGMPEARFLHLEEQFPRYVRVALRGAVTELVRNAVLHARSSQISIDIAGHARGVTVTVTDNGVGFDLSQAGWGLSESVLGRTRDAGIAVDLSAAPGSGTRAVLSVDTDAWLGVLPTASWDAAPAVRRIKVVACWHWALVLVVFGFFSDLVFEYPNRGASLLATALVAGACLAAALFLRGGRTLPAAMALVLIAAVQVGFWWEFLGVDQGRHAAYLWQPVSLSPLVIVVIIGARTLIPAIVAMVGLVVTGVVLGPVTQGFSDAGAVVTVAAVLEVAQCVGWLMFTRVLEMVATQATADRMRAVEAQVEVEGRTAVEASLGDWAASGALRALDLLALIASGVVEPSDGAIRARCAEEERYLRQILLLSPDLIHASRWIVRALDEARQRSIALTVRGGDEDLPEAVADVFGAMIVDVIRTTAAGSDVTMTLFAGSDPALSIVGPRDLKAPRPPESEAEKQWTVRRQILGEQALVEVLAR